MNIWELLPLTPFKSLLLLVIHYQVIYFHSHVWMILSPFPITFPGDYCTGLHIACLDQSLLVTEYLPQIIWLNMENIWLKESTKKIPNIWKILVKKLIKFVNLQIVLAGSI